MKLDYKVYNLVLNKPSGTVVFAEKTKTETGFTDEINPQVTFFASATIYQEIIIIVTDATCISGGKSVFMCVCSKTAEFETPIDPDNHDLIHHEA